MRGVNKVILIGNLAQDPEVRSTKSGKTVANFSLATNNEWRDAEGERKRTTDFHRIVAWQGLAETCRKCLKKGSPIYLEGRIHNRHWEDEQKGTRYVTEITADKLNFLSVQNTKSGKQVMLNDAEEEKEAVAA